MQRTIIVRRGNSATLPVLKIGEIAFAQDINKLYVGTVSGNVEIGGTSSPVIEGDLNMNTYKIINLADGSNDYDAVNKGQLDGKLGKTDLIDGGIF